MIEHTHEMARSAMGRLHGVEQAAPAAFGAIIGEAERLPMIPVNIFETTEGVQVVAPLPGLEPEDIEISIAGTSLTIYGQMRGLGQERKFYLMREWRYGPYLRTIELPFTPLSSQTRVTFGNGVLTILLMRDVNARPTLASRPRTIRLADAQFSGTFGSILQDEGELHIVGAEEAETPATSASTEQSITTSRRAGSRRRDGTR